MAAEVDHRTSGPPGTGLLAFRAVAATLSVLALLAEAGLAAASGLWLADLDRAPREPPGQIVALIPLAGAALGAALGLAGVVGLAVVVLTRRRAGRPRRGARG